MCIYGRYGQNKKYTANQKNGGIIPECKDDRTLLIPIGCGKCIECKNQKAKNWQVRLLEDVKDNRNGVFVTLTFSDSEMKKLDKEIDIKIQGYARDNEIGKLAVKRFRERWRKRTGKSPRHWLVSELGHKGTERIHFHGIIWTNEREWINKHWKYGYTWTQKKRKNVGGAIATYVTKYMTKIDKHHKEYKEIVLTSDGIGAGFIKRDKIGYYRYKGEDTNEQYITTTLQKIGMPIYYRNKLWTEEEREKLWINNINKERRFVLGEEISIKNGLDEYFHALMEARAKNKAMGYGSDNKNWNRIAYENGIRKLKRYKSEKKIEYNLVEQTENSTFDISKYRTEINNLINVF